VRLLNALKKFMASRAAAFSAMRQRDEWITKALAWRDEAVQLAIRVEELEIELAELRQRLGVYR
jgi:hypothetical protein